MAAQVEDLKWVRGTDFIVDGFRFQHPRCRRYFLTHAHSDHTTGALSQTRQQFHGYLKTLRCLIRRNYF